MKTIIAGRRYDTDTAEELLSREWKTYHPNISGGEPSLKHQRGVYRGKNGTLFGYAYDEQGYGRDRDGVTGAWVKRGSKFKVFDNATEALIWAEEEGFDADDLEKEFADLIEDA